MSLEVWAARLPRADAKAEANPQAEAAAEAEAARWSALLSPDELRRAAAMTHPGVRRRFVIGRGLLRSLLAERLGADPQTLCFAYTETGKPRLVAPGAVGFSLAHSGDRIVLALAAGGAAGSPAPDEVGVDVERICRSRRLDGIVRRFATPREREEYFALPLGLREEAFCRWWTRKEALVKAMGTSLARGLGAVSLPFDEREIYRVKPGDGVASGPDEESGGRSWLVATVPLEGGYWLSVARSANPGSESVSVHRFAAVQDAAAHPRLPLTLLLRW